MVRMLLDSHSRINGEVAVRCGSFWNAEMNKGVLQKVKIFF